MIRKTEFSSWSNQQASTLLSHTPAHHGDTWTPARCWCFVPERFCRAPKEYWGFSGPSVAMGGALGCYGRSSRLLWEGTSSQSTAHTVELTLMHRAAGGQTLEAPAATAHWPCRGLPPQGVFPVGKYFFHSVCCSFTLLIMFFEVQRYLILWSLSIFLSCHLCFQYHV